MELENLTEHKDLGDIEAPKVNNAKPTDIGQDGLPIQLPDDPATHAHEMEQIEEVEEEKSEAIAEKELPKKGFLLTVMNLLNSMLGAGILSVPNCFIDTGYILSPIIIVIIAILSYIATYFVLVIQNRTHGEGFSDLAYRTLGNWGLISLTILTLLFLASAQLAYIIIGGDMILSWFSLGGIEINDIMTRAIVILVYSVVLPIALTIPKNIGFLSYFSTATVMFIFFYVVVLTYKGVECLIKTGMEPTCIKYKFDISAFNTISIASLTFALPCVCLPSLKLYDSKLSKRNIVTSVTLVICTILVVLPSIFGYIQFGTSTNSNVLNSYPDGDVLMIITRGVFFFVVSFAYPLVSQSTMSCWSSLLFKISSHNNLPKLKRILVLALNNIIPLVIAMFLSTAKPILGIGGAVGGCLANFTYPAVMFLKTSERKLTDWRNILTILFAVFGVVAGVLATYQAVIEAIKAFS